MDREKVWVPDPDEGFVLGQIVDLTEEGALVQPLARSKKPIEASFDRLYPTEDDDTKDVDDNCGLMYLNEATLLQNIKLRYNKDKIYTYVANILIGINAYDDIKNLYDSKSINAYQGSCDFSVSSINVLSYELWPSSKLSKTNVDSGHIDYVNFSNGFLKQTGAMYFNQVLKRIHS